jgi:putative ABC transport system permease protein
VISEVRYVVRSLLRRKAFAFVAVFTLALGIGAATAIYAMVEWFLFQSIPSASDLFMIGQSAKDGGFRPSIWMAQFDAYRAQESVFGDFCYVSNQTGNVVVDGEPVGAWTSGVSPNFLRMLGIAPVLGRDFAPGDDVPGRNQEVVVSYGFWKDHLKGSPEALGSQILIDQEPCAVIGVLPKSQRMPPYCESGVYRPLILRRDPANPWDPNLIVIARTRPGVSRQAALEALQAAKPDIPEQMRRYLSTLKPALSSLTELQKIYRPEVRWMMLGAVGFLYAIACLNATNLMLVQLLGKDREISIRLALGASRWGVIRLIVIEALGLCLLSSALGALIANWLIPLFRMAARNQPQDWATWNLYSRTYWVLGALTLLTAALVAVVPAIHVLRASIQRGLRVGAGAVGESRGMARVRGTFVVLQATFAVILLVGAGLMIHTFERLNRVDIGFDPSRRVKIQVNFPKDYPTDPKQRMGTLMSLRDALLRVPGVSAVGFGSESLLAGYESIDIDVEAADGSTRTINGAYVSPDYRQAGGLALKAGKWLSEGAQGDVLVNETLARTRFGASGAVDQYLKPAGATGNFKGWRIVGVVGDVRENVKVPPGARVYMPVSWSPGNASSYVVDLATDPTGKALTLLRQAVFQFDPRIVTGSAKPLASLRLEQLRSENLALSVLRVLAAIAVFLTVVGMFTLLAYTVDRRMSEFGIRMALGASPSNLVALVMRRGMALTLIGVVIGIGGALALTRFLQSLLYETPPFEPTVLCAVSVLLFLAALGACTIPALRASKPDITKLLKGD